MGNLCYSPGISAFDRQRCSQGAAAFERGIGPLIDIRREIGRRKAASIKPKFPKRVDMEELLSPLGFEMEFYGRGFMKLESDELAIEFLAPEVGRPAENPLPIPDLRMNAQPMRHLSILWRNPIQIRISGFSVLLPHPADYCVQKLVVASRRRKSAKAEKDRVGAIAVLDAISENGELPELRKALKSLSKKEGHL